MAVVMLRSSEREKLEPYIGAELMPKIQAGRHMFVPFENGACFMMFQMYDVRESPGSEKRICIYCGSDFVFYGDSPRCLELLQALPMDLEPFQRLLLFFQALTSADLDAFNKLENNITALEDELLTVSAPPKNFSARIISMRHTLLKIRRYYEQLGQITAALAENENGALGAELQKRFESLDRRTGHLRASVLHLRDYTTQVREAYQAQIDIEQNQIMKIFTVITAIFLPLTLIVGWYGMNFDMPEYSWRFGYLYVFILSAVVCGFCFVLIKRKKWF